jgi:putative DNA primase/helicase
MTDPTVCTENVALNATDFLLLDTPPTTYLLHPVLPEGGLIMLYAPRGVGKTNLALSIALAVASGQPLFHWKVEKPTPVLYVDGEMPVALMQQRLCCLKEAQKMLFPPDNLNILSVDLLNQSLDLSNLISQEMVDNLASGHGLLVLDNLSSLMKNGENDSTDWQAMQEWLIRLRSRGVSVLLVHHAGKNGEQRGTSRREDVLDTVIALRRPPGYRPADGARFEVHIEKARRVWGEVLDPFVAQLVGEVDAPETTHWKVEPVTAGPRAPDEPERRALFQQRLAEGQRVEEIAKELNLSRATAFRWAKRAGETEEESQSQPL